MPKTRFANSVLTCCTCRPTTSSATVAKHFTGASHSSVVAANPKDRRADSTTRPSVFPQARSHPASALARGCGTILCVPLAGRIDQFRAARRRPATPNPTSTPLRLFRRSPRPTGQATCCPIVPATRPPTARRALCTAIRWRPWANRCVSSQAGKLPACGAEFRDGRSQAHSELRHLSKNSPPAVAASRYRYSANASVLRMNCSSLSRSPK